MRALSSLRSSCTALGVGLLLTAGLVLAPAAQASSSSSYIMSGTFSTKTDCLKVQRTYQSSWTRIVYSCYRWTENNYVFVYAPATH